MLLGMPIIVTDAISYGEEITQKQCGIVIKYSVDAFAKAAVSLLSDEALLKKYRQNALSYVKQFDFKILFQQNLKRIFSKGTIPIQTQI